MNEIVIFDRAGIARDELAGHVVKVDDTSSDMITRLRITFRNGYQASIIRGFGTYGADEGLYEMAVMVDDKVTHDTPITDDVIGWLSPSEARQICLQIAALPPRQ